MNIAHLTFVAMFAAGWSQSMNSQTRPMSVCDALNSAGDHQVVVIHAAIASNRHQTFLFEGTGRDPCPGWRKRFFTAPSAIPIAIGSYPGVHVSDRVFRANLDFVQRLRGLQEANPSARHRATVSGILVRARWFPIFRSANDVYCCWGEGADGGYAAVLVVTSAITEER